MSIKERKKHDSSALLNYMHLLDDGYSFKYIHLKYGICSKQLKVLRAKYLKEGSSALQRKSNIKADYALKKKIVLDVEKNHLTLHAASLKYGASASQITVWLRKYRQEGLPALEQIKNEADHQEVWEDQERTASHSLSWKDSRRRIRNLRQRLLY